MGLGPRTRVCVCVRERDIERSTHGPAGTRSNRLTPEKKKKKKKVRLIFWFLSFASPLQTPAMLSRAALVAAPILGRNTVAPTILGTVRTALTGTAFDPREKAAEVKKERA